MQSSDMKIGDLVFAKCTKYRPWPAKVVRVYDRNIYKVDFYNHDSFGLVDQADIEKVTFATLEKHQKINRKANKADPALGVAIRQVEEDFKRRLEIENEEVSKWKNTLPTRSQEKKLGELLDKQIKKSVPKPDKRLKDHLKKELAKKEEEKVRGTQQPTIKGKKEKSSRAPKKGDQAREEKVKIEEIERERKKKRSGSQKSEAGRERKENAGRENQEKMEVEDKVKIEKDERELRSERRPSNSQPRDKKEYKKKRKEKTIKKQSKKHKHKSNYKKKKETKAPSTHLNPEFNYSLRSRNRSKDKVYPRIKTELTPTEQLNTDEEHQSFEEQPNRPSMHPNEEVPIKPEESMNIARGSGPPKVEQKSHASQGGTKEQEVDPVKELEEEGERAVSKDKEAELNEDDSYVSSPEGEEPRKDSSHALHHPEESPKNQTATKMEESENQVSNPQRFPNKINPSPNSDPPEPNYSIITQPKTSSEQEDDDQPFELSAKPNDDPLTSQVQFKASQQEKQFSEEEIQQLSSLNPKEQQQRNTLHQMLRQIIMPRARITEDIQEAVAEIIEARRCETLEDLEERYSDKSLNQNQLYEMARSLPKVKRKLEAEDNTDLMTEYLAEHAVTLRKFVVTPFRSCFPYLPAMWQTQLFIAILDSDAIPLNSLFSGETIEKLTLFVRGFQKSKEMQRSKCHLEYMYAINKLDLWMYRFWKEGERKEGGKEELELSKSRWDYFNDLFLQFEQRVGRIE